jgi:ACS family glucarate transporter-like MFS transporter
MPLAAAPSREIFILMAAASAVNFFGRVSISIAGPEIMARYGLSAQQMGTVYSAFAAAYLIAMIPAAPLSDRFGPRRVLGVAGLVTSVCVMGTGLSGLQSTAANVVAMLLAIRFLFGLSSAPLYPACASLTANWFAAHRLGRIQGGVVGAGALGSTLAPVVMAALMVRYGWQTAFYFGAIATAFIFTLWILRVRDYPSGGPLRAETRALSGGAHRWTELLRHRQILLLVISYFCVGCLYDLFDYWTYYYFREVRSFGGASAVYTSVAQATAMVMMPVGGWLSDMLASRWLPSFGRRTVPVAALTLSAICLYTGSNSPGVIVPVAFFCAAFGLAASVEGAYWASVIQLGGRHTGLA